MTTRSIDSTLSSAYNKLVQAVGPSFEGTPLHELNQVQLDRAFLQAARTDAFGLDAAEKAACQRVAYFREHPDTEPALTQTKPLPVLGQASDTFVDEASPRAPVPLSPEQMDAMIAGAAERYFAKVNERDARRLARQPNGTLGPSGAEPARRGFFDAVWDWLSGEPNPRTRDGSSGASL